MEIQFQNINNHLGDTFKLINKKNTFFIATSYVMYNPNNFTPMIPVFNDKYPLKKIIISIDEMYEYNEDIEPIHKRVYINKIISSKALLVEKKFDSIYKYEL